MKFVSIPSDMKQNRPPSDGFQFFGIWRVDARSKVLAVSLHGLDGQKLYSVDLPPEVA